MCVYLPSPYNSLLSFSHTIFLLMVSPWELATVFWVFFLIILKKFILRDCWSRCTPPCSLYKLIRAQKWAWQWMPIISVTEKWSKEDREFKFILNHVVSWRPVWAGWDSDSINKTSATKECRNPGKEDLYSQGKGTPLWTQKRRGNMVTASWLDMRSLGYKWWPVCLSTEFT